jgi:hypothetical protein
MRIESKAPFSKAVSTDLRLADPSSRGVLPCVCMCVIKKPRKGRPKVRPGL